MNLYIPRIYPETILKHLPLYKEVFEDPFWVEVIQIDLFEGIRAYVMFLFEHLGYGSTIRVDLTKVNDFYKADVFFLWKDSADTREFLASVSAGNYKIDHPDQSFWYVSVNTKRMELEPMGWVVDTQPSDLQLPENYYDFEDPSLDYDTIYD
jgi:hypothetical protein